MFKIVGVTLSPNGNFVRVLCKDENNRCENILCTKEEATKEHVQKELEGLNAMRFEIEQAAERLRNELQINCDVQSASGR